MKSNAHFQKVEALEQRVADTRMHEDKQSNNYKEKKKHIKNWDELSLTSVVVKCYLQ
jgi:hypothetical protein